MGLSIALSNALSGMRSGQNGLDVLSRNVANSGVPGYHRQSLSVIDTLGVNSTYVRNGTVTRAFNESLQQYYTRSMSDSGFSTVRSSFVDRLQTVVGKPGAAGSLDTAFADFQSALSAVAVSPDNYAVRADAVARAGMLASTLNDLTYQVQTLRREAESKIQTTVNDFNQMLSTLEQLNNRLADASVDPTSRAALLDQRDRLVTQVASVVDLQAAYRPDGTVALMTRSGVSLLDGRASVFEFQSAGTLNATSQFNADPAVSGVGKLMLRSPAGLTLELVQQNVLRSGELGALIELRDRTLVQAQDQLDEVAAALATALSTVETAGTATVSGPAAGFEVDISALRSGNDIVLSYQRNNVPDLVRFVRVDDASKLPMDVRDADGRRVVGIDFSGGASAVALQIRSALGAGFGVDNPAGDTLRIVDDGVAGTTRITGLVARHTATGTQNGELALSLFVDSDNRDYTGSLDGNGQQRGFAGRIAVNAAVLDDMTLMVRFAPGGSLGEDDRPDHLLDRLDAMRFASFNPSGRASGYRLSGAVGDYITQFINHTGNVAAAAIGQSETQRLTMQTLEDRLEAEYGVDIDEEMARLMELQNAYAANARVLTSIQELLNQLFKI